MNEEQFIKRSINEGYDTTKFREYLVERFNKIQDNIDCGHKLPCAFYLAEGLLVEQYTEGPIVECGCFKGGMSAKFSVICKELQKDLYLIDSFQGLPCDELSIAWNGRQNLFKKGRWKGSISEVKENIRKYGEYDICKFREGWFEDIIEEIDIYPSFIFIDVDIVSSAQTCIKHFWKRLRGNRFYTHEACYKTFMNGILDEKWWEEQIKEPVPECVGRVNGFYDAQCLAYLKKAK